MSLKKKKNDSKKTVPLPVVPSVQKTASLTPKKRSAEEDLPSTSSLPGQLIAYVHEVSPTKTNRQRKISTKGRSVSQRANDSYSLTDKKLRLLSN